jgi:hypothetical protein
MGNGGFVNAKPTESHGKPASATLAMPPLAVIVLKPDRPLPELPVDQESASTAIIVQIHPKTRRREC